MLQLASYLVAVIRRLVMFTLAINPGDEKQVRGLDIFSGAGGSSSGARSAGVRLAAAVDMCSLATATYKANFPGTHVVTARLEDVNVNRLQRCIGQIDILLASPECTNHSNARGGARKD